MCATIQRSLAAGGCTSCLGLRVIIASMPCFPQMAKMAATAGRPLEEVLRWSHNAGSYSVTAHRGRGGGLTSTAEQVWLGFKRNAPLAFKSDYTCMLKAQIKIVLQWTERRAPSTRCHRRVCTGSWRRGRTRRRLRRSSLPRLRPESGR